MLDRVDDRLAHRDFHPRQRVIVEMRAAAPTWSLTNCTMSSISKALLNRSRIALRAGFRHSGSGLGAAAARGSPYHSPDPPDAIVQTCVARRRVPGIPGGAPVRADRSTWSGSWPRQVLARAGGWPPPRLERRGCRRAHRGARAQARRGDLRRDGEAYFRAVEREVVRGARAAPPRGGGDRRRDVRRSGPARADEGRRRGLLDRRAARRRSSIGCRATGAARWPPTASSSRACTSRGGSRTREAHVRLDASRASVGDLADQVVEWLGA